MFERFNLQIETLLNIKDQAINKKQMRLVSRDISCAGVYLHTDEPLPKGTKVDLEFLLNQAELDDKKTKDTSINIITSGSVIRLNSRGMAVSFDKIYKIGPTL